MELAIAPIRFMEVERGLKMIIQICLLCTYRVTKSIGTFEEKYISIFSKKKPSQSFRIQLT